MVLTLAVAPQAIAAADISVRHATLRAAYREKLDALSARAAAAGETDAARTIAAWLPAPAPNRLMLARRLGASDAATEPDVAVNGPWRDEFVSLRSAQADALFALARDAVAEGEANAAFRLLPEVIRENPEHAEARKILGYEHFDGKWRTPFEAAKARQKQVWSDRFGWLPAADLPRYEAGERFYNGRWMSVEAEERLRTSTRRPWEIVTEHYNVETMCGLEAGVELAVKLERLYDAWQQLFAGFAAPEDVLARRFRGGAAVRSEPRRHKVIYFHDRDEYIRALVKDEPNIAVSSGLYVSDKREAYFYRDPAADDTNLHHEATHQLFSEVRRSVRDVGHDANFWVVEGIACYMESLLEHDGWHFLGGNDAVRLRDAEHRLLVDSYYVPLAELTSYGMDRLKRDPNIPMLYSESAGLTHFLIDFEAGRYRRPLIDYLSAIYQGRARPSTLAELCNTTDAELDAQYRQFIESLDRQDAAAEQKQP